MAADLTSGAVACRGSLQAGKLLQVRYHGVDARNRPYTVTAVTSSTGRDRNGSTWCRPEGRRA